MLENKSINTFLISLFWGREGGILLSHVFIQPVIDHLCFSDLNAASAFWRILFEWSLFLLCICTSFPLHFRCFGWYYVFALSLFLTLLLTQLKGDLSAFLLQHMITKTAQGFLYAFSFSCVSSQSSYYILMIYVLEEYPSLLVVF